MITWSKTLITAKKILDVFSSQQSLTGLISIAAAVGVTVPAATLYATAFIAICGFLKVLMPDAPATVTNVAQQTVTPTVVVQTPDVTS